MTPEEQKEVIADLEKMIGQKYVRRGCAKLVEKAYAMCGLPVNLTKNEDDPGKLVADGEKFFEVDRAQFGDVALFKNVISENPYHVAFMIGRRKAIQSSGQTNGVSKIDITEPHWNTFLRGIYRHKDFPACI